MHSVEMSVFCCVHELCSYAAVMMLVSDVLSFTVFWWIPVLADPGCCEQVAGWWVLEWKVQRAEV